MYYSISSGGRKVTRKKKSLFEVWGIRPTFHPPRRGAKLKIVLTIKCAYVAKVPLRNPT
jgi:hypothetical protein